MLHAFITDNHDELVARARARVIERRVPRATPSELSHGIPLFLTQLVALLTETMTRGEEDIARNRMTSSAGAHGQYLLAEGLSIAQVVHDYGNVCQAVTELAAEREVRISASEFRALNRCLDDAIAGAVTEYARARETVIAAEGVERLGALAHELRNVLSTAMLSFDAIKRGVAGTGGSTGEMLGRSLGRLRDLIDRALTDIRLDSTLIPREHVLLRDFMEDVEIDATILARARGIDLAVTPVEPDLVVDVDRQVLAGALANLLQNAFKFTRTQTLVSLRAHATAERVYIDVEDECGGLAAGVADDLLGSLDQRSFDPSKLGRGLAIARRAVEANGGELRVRNLPHKGCCFTIDLPRVAKVAHEPAHPSSLKVQVRR